MALSFVELTRLQASDRPMVLVFPEPDECYAAGQAGGWAECLAHSDVAHTAAEGGECAAIAGPSGSAGSHGNVKVAKKRGRPRKVQQ